MYELIIGGVSLRWVPPPDAVTTSGGGRPVNERKTIEGRIVATRSPLPESRRVQVSAPQGYVITAADAAAIRALGSGPFPVTFGPGYEAAGSYSAYFEEPPRFRAIPNHPEYVSYEFTLYIPQEG